MSFVSTPFGVDSGTAEEPALGCCFLLALDFLFAIVLVSVGGIDESEWYILIVVSLCMDPGMA